MVTFRFYVVSIVAFFLALAVGLVIGSVLDEGLFNSMADRLEGVERNLDETVASIDDKNRQISELERYVDGSASFAVASQLAETTSMLVIEPGVPAEPVEDLARRLREAGSQVAGLIWLEPRWDLTEDVDADDLRRVAGLPDAPEGRLRSQVWEAVLAEAVGVDDGPTGTNGANGANGATSSTSPTSSTLPTTTVAPVDPQDGDQPVDVFELPLLQALEDEGFLRLAPLDGPDLSEGGELLLVSVASASSELEDPGSAAAGLAGVAASADVPTVLAESATADGVATRGTITREAIGSALGRFSTVDHLDLLQGRVATVLALADGRSDIIGSYGYGEDVDGVLPRWQGP